jgi:S-DNA-T family DNA segregation ATPase FtsK/SpoIIIE
MGILRQELEALHAPQRSVLPEKVVARLMESEEYQSCRGTLVVCAGEQETQPLFLDLVSAGPHAVVTGMTGSGKTEFLRAWLIALCCSYPADQLSLLIVDFKGGAGFQDLEDLPHVAGIVTDLNTHEVHRAVMSLQAEVRYREKVLVDQRVSDIRELPHSCALSRLIVVVDEYRALLERFPECAQIFIDLTSRGRALGIHVVLSSQQVGTALGDAVLANCALRISFRVAHSQDSLALVGSDAAYTLDHTPGRGVLRGTGIALREFQAPLPRAEDVELVKTRAKQWEAENPHWRPRKPWLAPLPRKIVMAEAPQNVEGAAWLGLADLPEHQAQSWVQYIPARHGNMLVTGPARSGVSSALQVLATRFHVDVITHAERAWDVVVEEGCEEARVLIIDNLEAILDEFTHEHREEFIRCLSARARELPRTGRAVIATWSASAMPHLWLSKLFSSELTLHSARMQGRASWDGHDVQLVAPTVVSEQLELIPELECREESEYLVITRRLHAVREALASRYPNRVTAVDSSLTVTSGTGAIIIGTPDAWLSRHAMLEAKREGAVLVLDSCSVSELRSLRVRPGLFPHVDPGKILVMEPDGTVSREKFKY